MPHRGSTCTPPTPCRARPLLSHAVAYLIWAYTPDHWLAAVGITYYPSKQWAVTVPAWGCVTILAGLLAYEA